MSTPLPTSPPLLERLALHSWTTRALSLEECLRVYAEAGVAGISVWREHIEPLGIERAVKLVRASGLRVPALVRAGFFVHADAAGRAAAVEDCKRALSEAAAIGAEMLVIVPGSRPGVSLADGRAMVRDALGSVVDAAAAQGVKLAIEPLHPMYAADRSCVITLTQARELVAQVGHPMLGVAVDVFHVWWDPALEAEIRELGQLGRLFAFHVCDWKPDMRHMLTDRGCMGEGCIPIRTIRSWMEAAGFAGMIEVEIFSDHYWAQDQAGYIERIKRAYVEHV